MTFLGLGVSFATTPPISVDSLSTTKMFLFVVYVFVLVSLFDLFISQFN